MDREQAAFGQDPAPVTAPLVIRHLNPIPAPLVRADELPQLWNVLKGEMSLVGPRPERPHFVGRFAKRIPNYTDRLRALPGITGLAQVLGSYDGCEADVQQKLGYDLMYISNCRITEDMRILFRTVQVVLTRKGAR